MAAIRSCITLQLSCGCGLVMNSEAIQCDFIQVILRFHSNTTRVVEMFVEPDPASAGLASKANNK